jgi:Skp family chaperone for outer membrane proteins
MRAMAWLAAAACLATLGTMGCNRQPPATVAKSPGVAVIDLDAIAHRLGSDKQIVDSISQKQSSLSQQLVELAKSYNQQIADRKKALEQEQPKPSDVTLAAWEQQANENLNKVKRQAAADLDKHRAALIQQFRDQIKPAARKVAESRGLSVIVTKNDNVLYDFSASADITDAVVAELLAARTASTAAAPASAERR